MISFLLLFWILISTPVCCLPASGVTLHIDISMFVSGLAKDVAILQYGVVDELTMRLASSISMPDNITYAEFNWNTDNIEEPELYEIDITSTNNKVLLSDITGIEPSGVVPTEATDWKLNLRCVHVSTTSTPMKMVLKLYSPDRSKEFTGIEVSPTKICQNFHIPACTKYPEGIKEGSSSKVFTISSLNYYESVLLQEDSDERIDELSSYIISSKSHVFVVQNMNLNLQEQLMINTFNTLPYHIATPRKDEASKLNSGLLVLSAKPIVVCDYVEYNEYDEFKDNGKLYGAVIAGVEIGQNRIVFTINLIQPSEESDYSVDYSVFLEKLNKEVNDIITKYKATHKDMYVMTVYTGYFAVDSGDYDATTVYYNDIIEQLHVVDVFNTNWEITDNLKHVRSEFILIPKDNKEFYNEEITIDSTNTLNVTSTNSYEYDGEEMKLVSPHKVVTATFRFWPSDEPEDNGASENMKYLTLIYVLLLICVTFF